MAIEVKLPELGDGIESGDVLDVLIAEGDTIEKDQAICELETDKATVEIPSSHSGKIVKIHVTSGDNIPIGSTLVTLEAASEEASSPPPTRPESSDATPEPSAPTRSPEETSPQAAQRVAPSKPADPTPAPPAASEAPSNPVPAPDDEASDAPAGPAIRRLAREVGIDLRSVRGSGESGRITREDVLVAVRQSSHANTHDSAAAPAETSDASQEAQTAETTVPATSHDEDDWGPIRVERMTKIRKTIARKMSESWTTAPRVTNFDDADVTDLESIRQSSKRDYEARGLKLTAMPFVIKAVALALRNNATINASLDEENEQIIYKRYVNIGIAVDTDRGLVVPSLRQPDELGIPEITRALGVLASNVRDNNFKIEDLRGSTFTISNLGAVGGTYSTPIINVPEVAILLLGRTRKVAAVVDDELKARLMMPLSLSYDHRVVDGATAARFLNDVKGFLEQPSRLLIAP